MHGNESTIKEDGEGMRQILTERIKKAVRSRIYRTLYPHRPQFDCPICGYHGPFKDKVVKKTPLVVRVDSKCLGCAATERHRMMHLVINDVFGDWEASQKAILHIAPEECMKPQLQPLFKTYHTADLLQKNVDFNEEDVQAMSFDDATYDAVLISRVLTIPPDLEACVREIRRVLKPGGIAIIAEIYTHEKTVEFGKMVNDRSREIGVDFVTLLGQHFSQVERFLSEKYNDNFQLTNRMVIDGEPSGDYPELVQVSGIGFMDLVAVCRV